MASTEKYNIFVPIDIENSILKSESQDGGEWYVQGYATTPDLDLQGDIILPQGIDISYFISKGWINYEHKNEAEYIIGAPTDNCYVDINKGLFVEAKLMKENKHAQSMWKLANAIQKSGIRRNLGFSIEGAVVSRNARDNRIIEAVVIHNVALTTHPANPQATWETLVKSWTTGYESSPETQVDGGALRREMFKQDITNLTYAVQTISNLYGKKPDEKEFILREVAKSIEMDISEKELTKFMLQLSRGVSYKEASAFIEEREGNK